MARRTKAVEMQRADSISQHNVRKLSCALLRLRMFARLPFGLVHKHVCEWKQKSHAEMHQNSAHCLVPTEATWHLQGCTKIRGTEEATFCERLPANDPVFKIHEPAERELLLPHSNLGPLTQARCASVVNGAWLTHASQSVDVTALSPDTVPATG